MVLNSRLRGTVGRYAGQAVYRSRMYGCTPLSSGHGSKLCVCCSLPTGDAAICRMQISKFWCSLVLPVLTTYKGKLKVYRDALGTVCRFVNCVRVKHVRLMFDQVRRVLGLAA